MCPKNCLQFFKGGRLYKASTSANVQKSIVLPDAQRLVPGIWKPLTRGNATSWGIVGFLSQFWMRWRIHIRGTGFGVIQLGKVKLVSPPASVADLTWTQVGQALYPAVQLAAAGRRPFAQQAGTCPHSGRLTYLEEPIMRHEWCCLEQAVEVGADCVIRSATPSVDRWCVRLRPCSPTHRSLPQSHRK